MKNLFRTLPAVLALTGALFGVTPAPPAEAQICVPITVCFTTFGITVCVTVGELCV